jgi:hypothetical protein
MKFYGILGKKTFIGRHGDPSPDMGNYNDQTIIFFEIRAREIEQKKWRLRNRGPEIECKKLCNGN